MEEHPNVSLKMSCNEDIQKPFFYYLENHLKLIDRIALSTAMATYLKYQALKYPNNGLRLIDRSNRYEDTSGFKKCIPPLILSEKEG